MGAFIGLWIAQIVFGGIVAVSVPKRDDDGEKAGRLRSVAVFAGLIPCIGFMLFMQITALLMYLAIRGRDARMHQRLQGQLQASFGPPEPREAAPGRQSASEAKPSQPRSDNPFL